MSINVVKEQIERFLGSDMPEVIAIKGAWGVGKTYTWNKFLQDINNQNNIRYEKYSYISLFGINSLESLKHSIFEHTINRRLIGKPPSLETLKENTDTLLASFGRQSFSWFQGISSVKNFATTIQSASFLWVNKTIICIDDFERKSQHVSLRDVLGLVLLLKEQRNCKIVLIFNDEKMGCDNSDEYRQFREKVIDFEIEFKPSPRECIQIALPENDALMRKIGEHIEQLGINNIRIIKKIERVANIVFPILEAYEKKVLDRALHALCLYSLCFYSREKAIPNYEYVKNIGLKLIGLDNENEQSDEVNGWNSFLREYGYVYADELDLRIAEAVENGYIHKESLHKAAKTLHDQFVASNSKSSFFESWRLYYDSFADNKDEVINHISKSFSENAKHINKFDLNSTVRLFRELCENELADNIINLYIETHKENPSLFNLDDHVFSEDITDAAIRERFTQLARDAKVEKTARDVLSKMADKDSWGDEDERILANASREDLYEIFKTEEGKQLSSYIDICLRFGRFVNPSEFQKQITCNATSALKRIAKENSLNSMRVKRFGISLDSDDENA